MWFPLLVIFTPSPAKSVQSILFALMAPVRYGTLDNPILEPTQPKAKEDASKQTNTAKDEIADPRRSGVTGGDTIRDCAIIEYAPPPFPLIPFLSFLARPSPLIQLLSLPPVLCDPAVAKAHYEKVEKEVEAGVKQSHTREKAFPQMATAPAEHPTPNPESTDAPPSTL